MGDLFRTTDFQDIEPGRILRPGSIPELARILESAHRDRHPLHIVSRGRNFGYGDRNVLSSGMGLLDLSALSRILEVNTTEGYAIVEPGVSQRQLSEHLREMDAPWRMDVTGGDPEASIVGNALERGFGHTPYGDHESHGKVIEALLPDGRPYRPHLGWFDRARTRGLYQLDVGPSIEKLLYQSNLAVVTQYCVWLMPRHEAASAFFVSFPDTETAAAGLERLAHLKRDGVIQSVPHMANALRVLSSTGLPEKPSGETFSERELDLLCAKNRIGRWNVSLDITGSPEMVRARKKALRRAMKGSRHFFFDSGKLPWVRALARCVPAGFGIQPRVALLEKLLALYSGAPEYGFLASSFLGHPAYLRMLKTSRPDLLAENLGLAWVCPMLPPRAEDLKNVEEIVSRVFREHGFEPAATVSLVGARTATWVSSIGFDKADAAQVERARRAYDRAVESLLQAGYPPYRMGYHASRKMGRPGVHQDLLLGIKAVFDPNGILSPGRWGLPPF